MASLLKCFKGQTNEAGILWWEKHFNKSENITLNIVKRGNIADAYKYCFKNKTWEEDETVLFFSHLVQPIHKNMKNKVLESIWW